MPLALHHLEEESSTELKNYAVYFHFHVIFFFLCWNKTINSHTHPDPWKRVVVGGGRGWGGGVSEERGEWGGDPTWRIGKLSILFCHKF